MFSSRITTIVAFGLIIGLSATSARAQTERYLIRSDDAELHSIYQARHTFEQGFSADLTKKEVHLLRRKGVHVTRVPKLQYSKPPGACSPWPECKNGGGDPTPTPTPDPTPEPPQGRTEFPDDQTPWGMESTYQDNSITMTSGGFGVKIAILDGGVDTDHPDLIGRLSDCADFTGNGKRSFVQGSCEDKDGHGTHVSGTALADGGQDGLGIYGVAPEADLLAYKVCKPNGCYTDDIAAAIDYAGSHDAQIVSMSLGGDSESSLIRDAIARNPHLLFVAAAGNDGPSEGSIDFPAGNAAVVAVAAVNSSHIVASFSSRGINDGDGIIERSEVELAAPGVNVESSYLAGGYAYLSGTSMATPHVAGLAAKLWQGSAAATRSYLQSNAIDLGIPGDDSASGFGLAVVP